MQCSICGCQSEFDERTESDEIARAGWESAYWDKAKQFCEPVCPNCVRVYLQVRADGEYETKPSHAQELARNRRRWAKPIKPTNISRNVWLPVDWWVAFEGAARAEGVTLVEWIATCCVANLPESARQQLSEWPPDRLREYKRD